MLELEQVPLILILVVFLGSAIGYWLGRRPQARLLKELQEAGARIAAQEVELTRLKTTLELEGKSHQDQLKTLQEAKNELSGRFENLAQRIFEEKAKTFREQNQQSLGEFLNPLKSRITEFQSKVEEVYVREGKERHHLGEQLKELLKLNHRLSEDARDLTDALKGSSKTQGAWGEMILETVLQAAGLRAGHEYEVQVFGTNEDGRRLQPDVIIHLPEDRHLIVDSKVSLRAYEAMIRADSEEDSAICRKKHLESVRSHIRLLAAKNYPDLLREKTLDFVLMFLPVEPAFLVAVAEDNSLFLEAFEKNVLLVSPSTLLFVLRTVAHLWRQEAQSRNAQEIAQRGAELYDRLAGFVDELQKVGERLDQAQKSYDTAYSRLSTGRGNVLRQAQMLVELGVKPRKNLPEPPEEGVRPR